MTDLGIVGLGPGEVVGSGGNAIVYRALQLDLERGVAVKLLRGGYDDDSKRRFERERRAMAALPPHDGIAPVYSSGVTATGEPYLIMPLYERGSLQAEPPALSWRRSVEDIAIAADAIAHAHANGVLHRDLKPANLMRTDDGSPVIVDFGIASIVDETQSGALTLTPSYAPPEAFDGDQPDERVDVYGLGATLHALLSGADPFGLEDAGVWQAIKSVRTDPPRRLASDVPESVCQIVERAMAKEPGDRYQTAAAMREDLHGVLADPATHIEVPVGFDGWHDRAGSGRKRFGIILAVAAGLVAVAALALMLVFRGGGETAVELETPTVEPVSTLQVEPTPVDRAVRTETVEPLGGRAARQEPVTPEPTGITPAQRVLDPDNGCLPVIEACLGDSLESLRASRGLAANVQNYDSRSGAVVRSEWPIAEGGVAVAWSVGGSIEQLMVDLSNGIEGTTQQIEPGIELEATVFADVIVVRGLPFAFHGSSDGSGGVRPFVEYCTTDDLGSNHLRYDALIGTDNENLLSLGRQWEAETTRGPSTISLPELVSEVAVSRVFLSTPAWESPYPTCGGLQEPYSWCPDVDDALNVRAEPRLAGEIVARVASGDCGIYTVAGAPGSGPEPTKVLSDDLFWVPVRVSDADSFVDGWVAERFIYADQPCGELPICS